MWNNTSFNYNVNSTTRRQQLEQAQREQQAAKLRAEAEKNNRQSSR